MESAITENLFSDRRVGSEHVSPLPVLRLVEPNPFEELQILNKTWNIYRMSPLSYVKEYSSIQTLLQSFVDSLNQQLKSELHGPSSLFLEETSANGQNAEATMVLNQVSDFSYPLKTLDIQISYSVRMQDMTLRTSILYCTLLSFSNDLVFDKQGDLTNFPLMLLRGPLKLYSVLIHWLESTFDTRITPCRLQPIEIQMLLTRSILAYSTMQADERPLELTYAFPNHVAELKHLVLTMSGEHVTALSKSYQDDLQGVQIVEAVERHFFTLFKIRLSALMLVRVGNAVAYVANEGKLKLFSCSPSTTYAFLKSICDLKVLLQR